jgi:hypothetical protein
MNEPFVTVHVITYNEEVMIEFFINHYRRKFPDCLIRVYDNHSTDKTVEIARSYGCEIHYYDSDDQLNDYEYLRIKNHVWKDAPTDWVVVCDCDELIDISQEELHRCDRDGYTSVAFTGITMVNRDNVPLEKMTQGFPDKEYDKTYLFNKKNLKEINYGPGCHKCDPKPTLSYKKGETPFITYHYKYIGRNYSYERKKLYGSRISDYNKKNSFGFQYYVSEEVLMKKDRDRSLEFIYNEKEIYNVKNISSMLEKSVESVPHGGGTLSGINYVVALYFGLRKMPGVNNMLRKNPYSIALEHLKAVNTLNVPDVKKITLIVSEYDAEIDRGLIDVVNNFNSKIPVEIFFRKNLGYSYAAWNDYLNTEYKKGSMYDYYFLFEDDYIANVDYFYKDFIEKINPEVGYVCQFMGEFHSRLGNGLITANIIEKIFEKENTVFYIPNNDSTYDGAINNQVHFLDTIPKNGYKIIGMENMHTQIFQNYYGFEVSGNTKGPTAIAPVSENNWRLSERDAKYGVFRSLDEQLGDSHFFMMEKISKKFLNENEIKDSLTDEKKRKDIYCLYDENSIIGWAEINRSNSTTINAYLLTHYTGSHVYMSSFTQFKDWCVKELLIEDPIINLHK